MNYSDSITIILLKINDMVREWVYIWAKIGICTLVLAVTKQPGKTKPEKPNVVHNASAACIAGASTRLNRNNMVIPMKCVSKPCRCMWMASTCAGSHAILVFTTARYRCGSKPAPPVCLKRRYPRKSRLPRWMNCSPLSATKKQDLHLDDRRPANPLLSGLESGVGAHSASYSRDGRRCAQGQAVLQ